LRLAGSRGGNEPLVAGIEAEWIAANPRADRVVVPPGVVVLEVGVVVQGVDQVENVALSN